MKGAKAGAFSFVTTAPFLARRRAFSPPGQIQARNRRFGGGAALRSIAVVLFARFAA
jgi:hypothetical protein